MTDKNLRYGQPERPEDESMTGYRQAPPEIVELGKKLLKERHRHLHNKGVRISYLISEKKMTFRGKSIPGKLFKLNNRDKEAFKKDFHLVINESYWEELKKEDKEAAMDFILCFGTLNSKDDFKIAEPDFYGFYSNIEKYGMWNMTLKTLTNKIND